MAKDETEIGITGLPIPKKNRSPKKQHEFEKKRRANLGTNVGGERYSGSSYSQHLMSGSKSTSSYNPRARTFKEFVDIAEIKLVYGGEKKEPEDTRMTVTAADRKANTKAWQNYQAGHKGYKAAPHLTQEETSSETKPATPEEKRKIKLMQQLERLKREKSASRIQSDVAREEYEVDEALDVTRQSSKRKSLGKYKGKYESPKTFRKTEIEDAPYQIKGTYNAHLKKEETEIDEAKVDTGLSTAQKRQVRTARSGLTGARADYERRGAHRERDEMNKDAKDIRKGKLNAPQFQGKTGAERLAQVRKAKGV